MSRKTVSTNIAYDTRRKRYYVTLHQGVDEDGRRRRATRCFATYDQAARALEDFRRSRQRPDMTVGRWLNYWMDNAIRPYRAATTCYGYENMIRNHLAPALGDIRLQELTPIHLQEYMTDKLAGGLSPNTVRKHLTLMGSALQLAVRQGAVEKNAAEAVVPPKTVPPHHDFYSPEQIQALFRAVEGHPLEPAVKLAGYLGLRRSEICGLKWENVDLERGVLYICEARTAVGGHAVDKGPKSSSSRRRMAIGDIGDLGALLQRLHRQHLRDRLSYGPDYNPQGFVLSHRGQPYAPDYISGRFSAFIRAQGLPPLTLHGLRHSFASIANSQRVPLYSICKALGHSSTTVTSQIYTHLFDDTHQDVVEQVGKAIAEVS